MAQDQYLAETVHAFLHSERVATLDDLKQALGTTGTMTVFRKLKSLGYLSSYSHRGKYYTLQETPAFDEEGLWGWHSVWFSRYGNLVETAREFVEAAAAGFTAGELETILHVECKRALLELVRNDRLVRERIGGAYVYLAQHVGQRRQQRLRRQEHVDDRLVPAIDALAHELQAAIILFFSLLDEQQRRLYAGLESQKIGHGGDRKIADVLGSTSTPLPADDANCSAATWSATGYAARAAGARRRKKNAHIPETIRRLIAHDTGGHPTRGLKWCRTTPGQDRRGPASGGDPGRVQHGASSAHGPVGLLAAGQSQEDRVRQPESAATQNV